MVGEVARGLSLFGGASSEVRRCKCSVVVSARASFLPEIYLSIYLSIVVSPPSSTAQMALSSAQGSALLVLLEAPSKQAVDAFFCSCFRERHAAGPIDDARVAEIVESLGLSTPLVAAPLQRAAVALIGKVLYVDASAEQTAALFPPDFHSSLQALLTKVRPALALH